MDNDQLQQLVHEKGLENDVVVKGADLQRLLSLQLPYDLCMDFIQMIAAQSFTKEDWLQICQEHGEMLQNVRDRVYHGFLPVQVNDSLINRWVITERAQGLVDVHPAPSWENEDV